MGRNLALGIPTRITIFNNNKYANENFKLINKLDKLNNIINKEDYNIVCYKDRDAINLIINEDYVNNNIYNCIMEIEDTFFAEEHKFDINEYNQKNFPIKLKYNDKQCFDKTKHLYLSKNTYYIVQQNHIICTWNLLRLMFLKNVDF